MTSGSKRTAQFRDPGILAVSAQGRKARYFLKIGRMIRSTDERSDAELVTEVLITNDAQAREQAYRTLLERYWTILVVLLQARLSARDAEDAAQEAFIRAWRSLDQLDNPRLFLGWLLRIARNVATDLLRRRRTETSLESMDPAAAVKSAAWTRAEKGVEQKVEEQEQWEIVKEALKKLPERYRTVVYLRYLKGLSNQDMARSLGEPEGTIRNRLFRALGKLRETLERREASKT